MQVQTKARVECQALSKAPVILQVHAESVFMAVRRQLIAGNGISSIVSSQDQPVRRRQFDRILRFGIVGVAVIRDTPRATEFIGCGENASERGNWLGIDGCMNPLSIEPQKEVRPLVQDFAIGIAGG